MELSWLPGQRARSISSPTPSSRIHPGFPTFSACSCPGSDHPGPSVSQGRGSPEIDVLEAERSKTGTGQVVSQSGQFAPFTHDYLFGNSTTDQFNIYTPDISTANPYRGSALYVPTSPSSSFPANLH